MQQYFLCIIVDLRVGINSTKPLHVSTETTKWLPLYLLSPASSSSSTVLLHAASLWNIHLLIETVFYGLSLK